MRFKASDGAGALLLLCSHGVDARDYVTHALTLPDDAHAFVIDDASQRVFLSLPVANRVQEVSTTGEMSLITQFPTGLRPKRLALSEDGKYLYTTLNASGSFSRYDRSSGVVDETDISAVLGDTSAYDIVAGRGSQVFVSANTPGFAYIVRVDTNTGMASRVANHRVMRYSPTFAVDRDAGFLYVGDDVVPASIYKLDITQADAPIVAEDPHGAIAPGTTTLALNPGGTQLITGSAQIIRTTDLVPASTSLARGIGAFRADGTVLAVHSFVGANTITVYDSSSFEVIETINTAGCGIGGVSQFQALRRGHGWLLFGWGNGSVLCKIEDADFVFAAEFD